MPNSILLAGLLVIFCIMVKSEFVDVRSTARFHPVAAGRLIVVLLDRAFRGVGAFFKDVLWDSPVTLPGQRAGTDVMWCS